ncbi:MAG TPA: GFA family protein [Caulobacteraceae bacterium]|nr:GFA family protein [Caulobacteraceae bacterium]
MPQPLVLNGACHCGQVRFRVRLAEGLASARRCNCSYCRMRGAVAVTANVGDIAFLEGEDKLATYRFNTNVAEHHFCPNCGIYTHHRRRSNPGEYGVNAACLKGVSPFDFAEVPVYDGITHPSDRPQRPGYEIAGILKYESRRP